MTPIQELFDDTFTMLNSVATPEQKAVVFKTASREFFSYVYPIFFVEQETYNTAMKALALQDPAVTSLGCGYKDSEDIFTLGVGAYEIVEFVQLDECIVIRVKPLDYATFKLEDGYTGAFQYVVEFMLKKMERNNMKMLKSAGIDDGEGFEVEDIITMRDYLKKEFGVTTVGLVM